MKLSVVSTLYQSEFHLEEFVRRVAQQLSCFKDDEWELILVNDGSPDNSLELAKLLIRKFKQISVVNLSRNFGHHIAILEGLRQSQGERVFLIDSDLEEPPECYNDLVIALERDGSECAFGVQEVRRGGAFSRFLGNSVYRVMSLLSEVDIPRNLMTARLMTRRFVNAVNLYEERNLSIGVIWASVGFKQSKVKIVKSTGSETTYGFFKKSKVFLDTVVSSGSILLSAVSLLGLILFVASLFFLSFIFLRWIFLGSEITGWISTIMFLGLLSGFQIFSIGLIGLYVGRIMKEVNRRPRALVAEIWSASNVE